MKKVFLFMISLCLFSLTINAQQINQIDRNGLKQGHWEKDYTNGAVRYTGQFHNDKPYGEFKYFYPNGMLKSIVQYKKQGGEAYVQSFRLNGTPMAKGKFVHQKKDSLWRYYSDLDGKLVATENYTNGKKEGVSISYYPDNGKPVEIITYKNGLKCGPWKKFFPDGKLSQEGFYDKDTLNGSFHVFFVGGKLQMQGAYEKGLQNGLWIFYDSTGKVIRKKVYHQGIFKKKN